MLLHRGDKPAPLEQVRHSRPDRLNQELLKDSKHNYELLVGQTGQVLEPPTLFKPFRDPRLNARPWDLLRMRTKPVIGPSSPSFSMLKFAKASSPVLVVSYVLNLGTSIYVTYQIRCEHTDSHSRTGSRPSSRLPVSSKSYSYLP